MKPILYSYWRSSCAFRVRAALNLKEIDYEMRCLHLVKDGGQQNQAEYRALNPKGEVPFYVDDQVKISQSMAICLYLEDRYPVHPLLAKDRSRRAKAIELAELINSGIQPLQNLRVTQYLERELKTPEAQRTEWIQNWIHLGLTALEEMLLPVAGKFSLGDEPGLVDCFVLPQLVTSRRFQYDYSKHSTLLRIEKSCEEIPAFQKAMPASQPDAE